MSSWVWIGCPLTERQWIVLQIRLCSKKLEFPELKFEDDCRVLPTCVILALEAKRLLHKGCEAYLAHVIHTSIPKVILESVPIV